MAALSQPISYFAQKLPKSDKDTPRLHLLELLEMITQRFMKADGEMMGEAKSEKHQIENSQNKHPK
jgi:hypothetical protein